MTTSAILFNKLVGAPIQQDPLRYDQDVQMTGPEVVQQGATSDLLNIPSAASVGVYVSKSLFDEHTPYTLQGSIVIFHNHFMQEVIRQFSGVVTDEGQFSPEEKKLYDEFIKYLNGAAYNTTLDTILSELDFWLTEDIQNNNHPQITRVYSEDHPWMKVLTRTI